MEAALALLSTRVPRFRRLPVVDRTGRLAGVFTVDDALARIAAELGSIDRVIQGETPFIMDGLVGDEVTEAPPPAVRGTKESSA
jgi:CBS domain-containing protein